MNPRPAVVDRNRASRAGVPHESASYIQPLQPGELEPFIPEINELAKWGWRICMNHLSDGQWHVGFNHGLLDMVTSAEQFAMVAPHLDHRKLTVHCRDKSLAVCLREAINTAKAVKLL